MGKKPTQTKKRVRAIFAKRFAYAEDAHPVTLYLDAMSPDSQRTMGSALETVADILSRGKTPSDALAWHELRPTHVAALRDRMVRSLAPATTNRYLTAVRGVLKAAWRLGFIDREAFEQAIDVAPARGRRAVKGRAVPVEEVRRLFAACAADENAALGARDAAVLAVLFGTGMRRAEVASAQIENLHVAEGRLRVIGKGRKERDVFLPNGSMRALERWIQVRGAQPGPLFTRVGHTGSVSGHGISAQLIYHIVRRRHVEAGVESFTPHDLRRSFISELLDQGVDLVTVARQVGHSNVQTTARYDRRDDETQRHSVQRLDVPFSG